MNPPERVIIGHRTYSVTVDDDFVDQQQPEDSDWQAFSDPRRQVIGLRSSSGPDDERDSVLHEVLHQCLRASGWIAPVPEDGGPDIEEVIIAAMVGPLLRTLRDNPELVAYLADQPENTPVLSP